MTETARLGALMIVHAEDGSLVTEPHGPAYAGFLASRPPAAEQRAIDLVVETARATGSRAHIVHLSAADALPDRGGGADVSVETCPHYLAWPPRTCPTARPSSSAARRSARPPTGTGSGRRWPPATSTSSSPTTRRARPSSSAATSPRPGAASRRSSSRCPWSGRPPASAVTTLADVVRWMATAPARRVGLAGKGEIAEGYDADLCVLAPDETFRRRRRARCSTRTPSRRTTGVRSPAPSGRPGCAAHRSTWRPPRAAGC